MTERTAEHRAAEERRRNGEGRSFRFRYLSWLVSTAARIGVVNVPIPSISIVTVSPALRNSGGLRPAPTPSGVPLEITSPGYSVRIEVRYRIMCASSQIQFDVLPSCFIT